MSFSFPALCIDDFYPNPDEVRKFALEQNFYPADGGTYPGKRTDHLHELDEDFFNYFCKRFMNVFYNYEHEEVNWVISSNFQLFPPYKGNNETALNKGIIHRDMAICAGVIYLTPNPNPDSGTSIYHLKDNVLPKQLNHDLRFDLHPGKEVDDEAFTKMQDANDSKFEETIRFQNRYNRLISYDAGNYHRANSYVHNDQERLIQVFFVEQVGSDGLPLDRWRHWS